MDTYALFFEMEKDMLQRSSFLLTMAALASGCLASDADPVTKAEARLSGGRGPDGSDLCERHGWYGDGECDAFCPRPDPDCSECPDPTDPRVRYLSTDPGYCAVLYFACEEGETGFTNECGCGCIGETPAPRDPLTPDECTALGGELEYDPGDGRTHDPDYVCTNGEPSLGFVSVPIEGAACCPPAREDRMTVMECPDLGGTVVADPGDGSTHRPDFRCENGRAPIGEVDFGIEGAVCCPPDHRVLTEAECTALGGELEYDPGDGRTHSPDYVCLNGLPSLGAVAVPIEGAACCPVR
jgi:hypothetical protein